MSAEVRDALTSLAASFPKDAHGRPRCRDCGGLLVALDCAPCNQARKLTQLRWQLEQSTIDFQRDLPPWPWARVDSPEFRERVADPRLRRFAAQHRPLHGNVCILGPAGIGKTVAMRALAIRWLSAAYAEPDVAHPIAYAHWTSALNLAVSRRETRLGDQDECLSRARSALALFLDEVGQEERDPRWLIELLDARYREGKLTVLTSGLTRAQFSGCYGSGALRRTFEPTGYVLDLFGGADA